MIPTQPSLFEFNERRYQRKVVHTFLRDLRRMLDTSERERQHLKNQLQERDQKIESLNAQIEKIMSVFGDVGDPLR